MKLPSKVFLGEVMDSFFSDCIFYHVYPLGLSGAPEKNDFSSPKGSFFEIFENELPRLKELGVNALYIGPIFESTAHGYDTVDYYHVDRRLGDNESFKNFSTKAHQMGFKLVLDAVFNHTGRDFFAFKDLKENARNSRFCSWYSNINFDGRSTLGDPFDYEGWAGCKDLVKLNVENPEVKEHLFGAVKFWIEEFNVDGLRLDAADVISLGFLRELSSMTKQIKNDFWLMGEVVHGDYNNWLKNGNLDSVTNYEAYKGLWSSFNSQNMFEIAYALSRQNGDYGIYKEHLLYNFLDNHDVTRIASAVSRDEYLFPLYGLLFTMPGIPSIYYGSEYGIKGKRNGSCDRELRPSLPPFNRIPDFANPSCDKDALFTSIKKISEIRQNSSALKKGNYTELAVQNKAFAFQREFFGEKYAVCVNGDTEPFSLKLNRNLDGKWEDVLNGGFVENTNTVQLDPCWLKILKKI